MLLHHRRVLFLLLVLIAASMATQAEIVRRTLVSQNYETAQAPDWTGDAGASITLATGDAVNGTCVQIESTDGNVGVHLPIQLPDEVFYRDQYMSGRGYVVEFDFMIRSGNVADVSQSQFFVLTQGTYPYYGGDVIEPGYSNLNAGGQPVNKWSSSIGSCLSQPMRTESTYSTEWFMNYSNLGTSKVYESDKWYHFSAYPEYVEEGQYPGFWFEYTIREKETGTWIYGGGSSTNALARLTGLCALVGQGGMLKFDNLEVYDYSNYAPPTFTLTGVNGTERTYKITNPNAANSTLFYTNALADAQPALGSTAYIRSTNKEATVTVTGSGNLYAYVGTDDNDETPSLVTVQTVNGVMQTLMAPFHWGYDYSAQTNLCEIGFGSDQSWLDYMGDDMPNPTIMYAIDNDAFTAYDDQSPIVAPVGSQLKYYATLDGYNDSPVVTVTVGVPFWYTGMNEKWWEEFGWGYTDKTPITLGEETETGLFKMQIWGGTLSDYLLTPDEFINANFMIRNYDPNGGGGKDIYDSRQKAPRHEPLQPSRQMKVVKKTRNLEDMVIRGIYSGDVRTYAVPDVKESGYIVLRVQGVENVPVVTAVEGCEVDPWNSQLNPTYSTYCLKVTSTGTARFTVNNGTVVYIVAYYEPAPPQTPDIYLGTIDGANRTYYINCQGATKIHYTTVPAAEQPALDSNAWSVAEGSSISVTTTGTGYIYAYGENSLGTSEVVSQYVNGVELTLATPFVYSKSYNSDTQLWTVTLYSGQNYIDGIYTNAKMYYSIDGGQETEYTDAFTIANGSQLSYYAKATGFTSSPTVTCTAGNDVSSLNLEQQWYEYYSYNYYSGYRTITLGDESETEPGWYQLLADGYQLSNGHLLTQEEQIDGLFRLRYYGLYSPVERTYALTGLNTDQYIRITTNDESSTTTVRPVEGLAYDAWSSTTGTHYFKVTANGTVKFAVSGKGYLRQVTLLQEPQYGYVNLADANGNTLKYYYESAESDAVFYGVTSYASDAEKAGHIIIADKVTDRKGREHNVTSVTTGVDNRSSLKSVVFGQNIKSIGNSAFYGCQQLESITLNSNLETLSSSTFENCYKLASVNLQDTKVTAIPSDCFYRCGLTEINIPATITEVGSYAFYGCDSALVITVDCATIPESCFQPNNSDKSKLTTINIGKNVKSIGNSAFYNQRHINAVNIDPEVSELVIGSYVFSDCDALETITLPAGVKSLGENMFYSCNSLKTVIFDENSTIETIPYNCFADCTSLETLTLPNSVKTVGTSVFSGCSSLRELTFGTGIEANGFPSSYYNYLFSGCSNMEKMTLPGVNFPFQQQYSGLPNSLTLFVNADLMDTYKESSYTKMYHIVAIGATTDFAIENEAGNLAVALPAGKAPNAITLTITGQINGTDVNYIHQSMPYLQELILTNAQIVEGGEAVKRWSVNNGTVTQNGSTTYTVKNNEVCDYMFNNMPVLKHIALPASAKLIGKYALSSNAKLEQVDMGLALTAIDEYAFYQDSKLSKADLPAGLLTIGQQAFYNTGITSVTVPEGVKRIEYYTFYSCDNLKTVILPDGLEYVGAYAFYYCSNLESVNIPKQVLNIGENAFGYCTKLATPIVIPAGCQTIGNYAFSENYLIPSVTFSDEPVGDRFVNLTASMWNQQWGCTYDLFTSSDMPFGHGSVPMDGYADLSEYDRLEVTVSEGAPRFCFNRQTANGQDTNDGVGSEMIDIPNATWSTQKYQTINGNVYSINLKQIVADQNHAYLHSIKGANWQKVNVTSMRLYKENTQTGVALTTIGTGAFSYCYKIEEVTLPESLTSLGGSAFYSCTALQSFTFPANIKEVPSQVLYNCEKLESVTLAEGTTRIGSSAFYECEKLTTINLDGQPLTRIDDSAFGNTALTSVTLPNTVTTMGTGVFQYCSQLESANIPTGVTKVPGSTFYECQKLTDVTLHNGITEIGSSAFYNSKLLATLALSNQITKIGSSAFSGCESLVLESLPTSLTYIDSYAFQNTKAMTCTLTIPETVTTLYSQAFYGSGITGVIMTKVPNTFGTEIFAYCENLANVTLPADLTTIPSGTFAGCVALKTIDLPASLTKISDNAFRRSGLETIALPLKLQTIGQQAFYGTQLTEIRVPKNVTSVGSYFAGKNPKLKAAYLGRKQNYSNNSYFDYFIGCDNLELLRVYAGTPPSISGSYNYSLYNGSSYDYYLYYTKYRTNCVLEVPEGTVDTYSSTNIWKDFKNIKVFESDDMLNDLDFAVMKDLYNCLGGADWTKPWDLSSQNHAIGKWQGVTTEVDSEDDELFYITAIDLTERGLVGKLPKSVFTLERLKTLNMSHNTIEAEVDTLLTDNYEPLTTLNMEGNHLKGDLYPFVSKLPNLTNLNVSYNWLTAYSQPTSNSKLDNYYMYRGYQFVDWKTKEVNVPEELADEVIIDFTPGTSIELTSNTLQIYRHEYGDYNLTFSNLYRLYKSGNSMDYSSSAEISKRSDNLWNLNTSNPLKAKKGLVAYTHSHPYYSYITYIFRLDWKDGDVNADQTVDVADLQNVVYYALNDTKPGGQVYNFTAADMNGDSKINVSDIVGTVSTILDYDGDEEPSGARIYNKVENDGRNIIKATANGLLIAHADEVAALQLTISGARASQLTVSADLKSRFTVSMRDVADGVRLVIYSPMGETLAPGESLLLSGMPAGAAVTDARLVDAEANRLSVTYTNTTSIDELTADDMFLEGTQIYDLSGRRVGKWHTLPAGVYIVNLNGKQFKVRK